MNKLAILIIAYFFLFVSVSNAQWDIKMGLTFSNYLEIKGARAGLGWLAGAGKTRSLSGKFYFKYEFVLAHRVSTLQNQKIINTDNEYNYGATTITSRRVFFELPFFLGCRFNVHEKINIFLQSGPSLSLGLFDLSSDERILDESESAFDNQIRLSLWGKGLERNLQSSGFGANISIGAGIKSISIELRYFYPFFKNAEIIHYRVNAKQQSLLLILNVLGK